MSTKKTLKQSCWKTAGRIMALAGLGALVAGCAGLGPRLGHVRVQAVSAGVVEVATIQAYEDPPGSVLVSGSVRTRRPYPAPLESHLDVLALNQEGRVLAGVSTRYSPWPIPRVRHGTGGQSSYTVQLPVSPPTVSVIQVAHHQSSLEKCEFPRKGGRWK